ncbi:MAG: GNAT family N-acetyltransferase [Pseudomonadota bacterium]
MTSNWSARSATAADLGAWLAFASAQAVARWPAPLRLLPADISWQLLGRAPDENVRLYFLGTDLVGYASLQGNDTLQLDATDGVMDPAWLRDVLAWAVALRRAHPPGYPFYLDVESMDEWAAWLREPRPHPLAKHRYLFVSAFEGEPLQRWLQREGFATLSHFEPHLRFESEWPAAPAHPRFRVAPVAPDEHEARVAVHRAAWAPSAGFTEASYAAVRALSNYTPALDLLLRDSDGTPAACAIAWADERSGVGMIEPFGTHPDYRGTGASAVLMQAALAALGARGMSAVRLYTAGFNRGARRFYTAQGFVETSRSHTMRLEVTAR